MRPGHKSSGRLEKGFEPDAQVSAKLVPIEERQLVDQDGSQDVAPGGQQPARGHLLLRIKDGFELAVEVLDGGRPELMEDPADFHAGIGVRIPARDSEAAIKHAENLRRLSEEVLAIVSVVHGEVLGEQSTELRAKLAGREIPRLFLPFMSK